MPGPVSDSYDPEFSTAENAREVREAIREIVKVADRVLGPNLLNIVIVVQGSHGKTYKEPLTARQWRLIRFACNRAIDTI